MALGLFTVLKSVPWSTVILNAPVLADGAKRLWNTVANRPDAPEPAAGKPAAADSGTGDSAGMRAQLAAVEAAAARLEQQMRASTELIKALAEQNAQLIERVEANRVRTLWLTIATGILGGVAVIGWAVLFFRL